MAKAKSKAAPAAKKGKKTATRRSGAPNRLLILLTCAALVPFSLPTLLLLFVGLLPTLVAVVAERGHDRYAWICVGGLNFAGLAPWLFRLWFGHHTLVFALEQITGISMLLVAYAAAGAGWLLYLGVPPLVQTFMAITSNRRQDTLSTLQKRLVEQWGDGVVNGLDAANGGPKSPNGTGRA